MSLYSYRATVNLVGVPVGGSVLADPDDPEVAVYLEKGLLVPDADSVVEGGDVADSQGDADDPLDPISAIGDGSEVALEPGGDG